MIAVDLQTRCAVQKALDQLISRSHGLKAVKGYSVLDTGIVRLEGDNVLNAHGNQLLQGQRAVQRLSGAPLMLAALIEVGHNYGDTAGLSSAMSGDAPQILGMGVPGHGGGGVL